MTDTLIEYVRKRLNRRGKPLKVERFISVENTPAVPFCGLSPQQQAKISEQLTRQLINAVRDYYNSHSDELTDFERGCRELDKQREAAELFNDGTAAPVSVLLAVQGYYRDKSR